MVHKSFDANASINTGSVTGKRILPHLKLE